jgi:hypothetical protein
VTQQATLTQRAVRDCARVGIDEDEVRDALERADLVKEATDPGDPDTIFMYSVFVVDDDRALVITWEQLAARQLVRRVSLLSKDEFS